MLLNCIYHIVANEIVKSTALSLLHWEYVRKAEASSKQLSTLSSTPQWYPWIPCCNHFN